MTGQLGVEPSSLEGLRTQVEPSSLEGLRKWQGLGLVKPMPWIDT